MEGNSPRANSRDSLSQSYAQQAKALIVHPPEARRKQKPGQA
jgi:hypothetical protein